MARLINARNVRFLGFDSDGDKEKSSNEIPGEQFGGDLEGEF